MFLTLTKRRLDCRYMYFADMCAKHIQTLRSTFPRFSHLMQSTVNSHGNCCGFSSQWPELIGSSGGVQGCSPTVLGGRNEITLLWWVLGKRWGSTHGNVSRKALPFPPTPASHHQHHRPVLWATNNPGNGKRGGQEHGDRVHNRNKRSQHSDVLNTRKMRQKRGIRRTRSGAQTPPDTSSGASTAVCTLCSSTSPCAMGLPWSETTLGRHLKGQNYFSSQLVQNSVEQPLKTASLQVGASLCHPSAGLGRRWSRGKGKTLPLFTT